MPKTASEADLVASGIPGLDHVLGGGLPRGRLYLLQGDPGAGKTTLALRFLCEGARLKEGALYVTLSETSEELNVVASSHGWSLDGITLFELSAMDKALKSEAENSIFQPSEVELNETVRSVLQIIEDVRPKRVVFDSLSELRLLAHDPLRYRRQILALKQFLAGRDTTVLFIDDNTSQTGDLQLQSIAHGVVLLEQLSPEYGAERRRLRVLKLRNRKFHGGYHDFIIRRGGLEVFPRLVAGDHPGPSSLETVSTGLKELDTLLGGGIDRGTATLILGPAGVGKSMLSGQILQGAIARKERAAVFTFDENVRIFFARAKGMGFDLEGAARDGLLSVQQIDPAELSPGQFVSLVRQAVEEAGARAVVIDSLNGYLNAMPEERFLVAQMHELLSYLAHKGVVTLLVVAQAGLIGTMQSPVDVTYLADSVLLLRFFEFQGELRQALSVLKKRTGNHERTIRELKLTPQGIRLGDPLRAFRGVLTGVPGYEKNELKPI